MPNTPMSSTCLAIHWFISPPFGGIRTIGVTFGRERAALDDLAAVEHVLERVAQRARVIGACSISKTTPS